MPRKKAAQSKKKPSEAPKKRGRPVGTGGNKRPDLVERSKIHITPQDNSRFVDSSLKLLKMPKTNMASTEAVQTRITEYFEVCSEYTIKPSVEGLALALGIDRNAVWQYRVGNLGKNPEVRELLNRVVSALNVQMTDYMQNGQINPVAGIFLMKNNFGYRNQQEVTINPQSPLGDTKDTKELEEQYIESVIVDSKETPET